MTNGTGRPNCTSCIHFRSADGWYCSLNSIADLRERGQEVTESPFPAPNEFICDDYEPP